jgi:hypothetical protein
MCLLGKSITISAVTEFTRSVLSDIFSSKGTLKIAFDPLILGSRKLLLDSFAHVLNIEINPVNSISRHTHDIFKLCL